MDTPAYTVTVSYLPTAAGSWELEAIHNPGEPVAGEPFIILGDPFTYEWSWSGEQVPGQLDPGKMSCTIHARNFDVFGVHPDDTSNRFIPQRGERMSFSVRIGTDGPFLVSCKSARVNEAIVTIDDADPDLELNPFPITMSLKLDDLLIELPTVASGTEGGTRRASLDRIALIAFFTQNSIGMLTAISRVQSTALRFGRELPENMREAVTTWANSQTTAALRALVATPYHQHALANDPTYPAYPAGYSWVGPSNPVGSAIPDPGSSLKWMLTAANPTTALTHKLPLRLAVVDGLLSLAPAPSTDTRTAAVDAKYCELPTAMRSSREHVPNTFRVAGEAEWLNTTPTPDVYETRGLVVESIPDSIEASDRGRVPRAIQTQLILGTYDGAVPENASTQDTATAAAVASTFAPTSDQVSEPWAVDKIKISATDIPQADAESLLPILAPAYPGEEGDGVLLRHLTVFNREARIRPLMIDGWIVAGRLAIADGELTYEVTTMPGDPTYSVATRITVGDVQAASWHAHPAGDIDPRILISDLANVDA